MLVGDPNQLPAPVSSIEAEKGQLSISLLQRWLASGVPGRTLGVQYRSHSAISEYPMKRIYHDTFTNGPDVDEQGIPTFPWPQKERPVCVITVGDQNTPEDIEGPGLVDDGHGKTKTSLMNDCEACVVQSVVETFHDRGVLFGEIGVITPSHRTP